MTRVPTAAVRSFPVTSLINQKRVRADTKAINGSNQIKAVEAEMPIARLAVAMAYGGRH
jgi:hypothetical protein